MEATVEQCPLCGSELSSIKLKEIDAKLREDGKRRTIELEQAKASTRDRLEQQFKLDLQKQKDAVEKNARQEAEESRKKLSADLDLANRKLKEAQEHEIEIRKKAEQEISKQKLAAEKKAKDEAGAQIKKATAERDQAVKKLKEADAREAIEKKRMVEDAEFQRQKELTQLRNALEKDRDVSLLKLQAEFNRQKESFQKQMKSMQQKLDSKTANELGDGAEIDLFETLKECFPSPDKISRIPKGQAGADILHEVFYKGESCGKIVTESKNCQKWDIRFVTKLRQDRVEAKAQHAILATTVFPPGKKEMCIESGVIVIAPARVVYITQVLRDAMIAMHVKGLGLKEQSSKMARLYEVITSETYSQKFGEAGRLAQEILDLDVQEKKAHDGVWRKRGTYATRMHNVLREVETDIAAVIEGADGGSSRLSFPATGVGGERLQLKAQEAVAWNKH